MGRSAAEPGRGARVQAADPLELARRGAASAWATADRPASAGTMSSIRSLSEEYPYVSSDRGRMWRIRKRECASALNRQALARRRPRLRGHGGWEMGRQPCEKRQWHARRLSLFLPFDEVYRHREYYLGREVSARGILSLCGAPYPYTWVSYEYLTSLEDGREAWDRGERV